MLSLNISRKYLPLSLLFAAFLFFTGFVSARAQSALDGFDPNANGTIRAVVVQPDGKIIIGGDFTNVLGTPRNYVARLNTNGTLDATFNPNANNTVNTIVVQTDGRVLAGGTFTNIGGQTRNYIARLDATTGAADSINFSANNTVNTIAVQTDGKILAGGQFTNIGGQARNRLARLDAATGVADSWNPNADNAVNSIVFQTDGKILAGGQFTNIGGQTRNYIARLDASAGLADSWNPNANSIVSALTVQADGKILAGGQFTGIGGQTRNFIARLDGATGAADSFNPNANGIVNTIAIQSDGKVLAGGQFTGIGGQARNYIARLALTSGTADSFDPNANSTVFSIATQPDGKILAGGQFTTVQPNGAAAATTRNRLARLERDGTLDQTLDLNAVGSFVISTAIQPDGKIIIGGFFSSVLGVTRNNIARLNADGTLDTAFDPNASGAVYTIALQTDGKILVGGDFFGASSIGGATRNYIARLNADGTVDSFDPNANSFVNTIAVQADGKILVGGEFSGANSIGGATRNFIARLNADGTADSFDPNANGFVHTIVLQSDGKILVGGEFNGRAGFSGVIRNYIARLNVDGTVDSFNPNANGFVNAIAIQSDGKILVGGEFNGANSIGGATRNRLARLNADGSLDTAFDPNASDVVYTIAAQSDGKILVGGEFNGANSIGGAARNFIARLNANGTADSFDPNANDAVYAVAVQSDGKILVGGVFSGANGIGGQTRNYIARLSNDTAALSSISVARTSITMIRNGSAAQFSRVVFEQSIDNGATYTTLGTATNSRSASVSETIGKSSFAPDAPTAAGYSLSGLNLPTGQNILIRARGFYRAGFQSASETIEDKVQNAFVLAPTVATVTISGRVITPQELGLTNAVVTLTDSQGNTQTTLTGKLGSFIFREVVAGETYILTVRSKRYTYAPQIVTPTQNLAGITFIAQ